MYQMIRFPVCCDRVECGQIRISGAILGISILILMGFKAGESLFHDAHMFWAYCVNVAQKALTELCFTSHKSIAVSFPKWHIRFEGLF
jgi:hypothetical protein